MSAERFAEDLDKLRQGEVEDRRQEPDRRSGGRPRRLTDRRLDWALSQIHQGKARRAIVEELGTSMRTLERRIAHRRYEDRVKAGLEQPKKKSESFLTFRCTDCLGVSRFPICPYCHATINPAFSTLTDHTHDRKLFLDDND